MSVLTKTSSGLVVADAFTRADSPTPGGDWITASGNAAIVSNTLKCSGASRPGARNAAVADHLEHFMQVKFRYQSDAASAYFGFMTADRSGYAAFVDNGTVEISLFVAGTYSGAMATDSAAHSLNTDYVAQYISFPFFNDLWVETNGSPLLISTNDGTVADYFFPYLFRASAANLSDAAIYDEFLWCTGYTIRTTGVPEGYTVQLLNSGASVVSENVSEGGPVTLLVSRDQGAPENVPFVGWPILQVLDETDTVVATYDATGIYPGDVFEYGDAPPPELEIETTSLPNGVTGQPYEQTLVAINGVEPYIWAISSGALPTGLTLDPDTGVISGTPTVAEIAGFDVEVTDDDESTAEASLEIEIEVGESGVVRLTQLPLEIVYDYSALSPYVVGNGELWRTPPPNPVDD